MTEIDLSLVRRLIAVLAARDIRPREGVAFAPALGCDAVLFVWKDARTAALYVSTPIDADLITRAEHEDGPALQIILDALRAFENVLGSAPDLIHTSTAPPPRTIA